MLPYLVAFGLLPAFVVLALPGAPPAAARGWSRRVRCSAAARTSPTCCRTWPTTRATGVRGLPHRIGARAWSQVAAAALLLAATLVLVFGPPGPPSWAGIAAVAAAVVVLPTGWYAGRAALARGTRPVAMFRSVIVVALIDVVLLVSSGGGSDPAVPRWRVGVRARSPPSRLSPRPVCDVPARWTVFEEDDVMRSMGTRRAALFAGAAAVAAVALAGCSAGQVAETPLKKPVDLRRQRRQRRRAASLIRGLAVAYAAPKGYPAGANAPLEVGLFNQTTQPITVQDQQPAAGRRRREGRVCVARRPVGLVGGTPPRRRRPSRPTPSRPAAAPARPQPSRRTRPVRRPAAPAPARRAGAAGRRTAPGRAGRRPPGSPSAPLSSVTFRPGDARAAAGRRPHRASCCRARRSTWSSRSATVPRRWSCRRRSPCRCRRAPRGSAARDEDARVKQRVTDPGSSHPRASVTA